MIPVTHEWELALTISVGGQEVHWAGWDVWLVKGGMPRQLELGMSVLGELELFFRGLYVVHALTNIARAGLYCRVERGEP